MMQLRVCRVPGIGHLQRCEGILNFKLYAWCCLRAFCSALCIDFLIVPLFNLRSLTYKENLSVSTLQESSHLNCLYLIPFEKILLQSIKIVSWNFTFNLSTQHL